MYYSGNVIVPNDLDEIILKKKKVLGKWKDFEMELNRITIENTRNIWRI